MESSLTFHEFIGQFINTAHVLLMHGEHGEFISCNNAVVCVQNCSYASHMPNIESKHITWRDAKMACCVVIVQLLIPLLRCTHRFSSCVICCLFVTQCWSTVTSSHLHVRTTVVTSRSGQKDVTQQHMHIARACL